MKSFMSGYAGHGTNHRHLCTLFGGLSLLVKAYLTSSSKKEQPGSTYPQYYDAYLQWRTTPDATPDSSPLAKLQAAFSLTDVERDILLLLLGIQLDPTLAALITQLGLKNFQHASVSAPPTLTFGMVFELFPVNDGLELLPAAPLRRWRLIELEQEGPLTSATLTLPERIFHYLMGHDYLDEALLPLLEEVNVEMPVILTHTRLASRISLALEQALLHATPPTPLETPSNISAESKVKQPGATQHKLIQLCGADRSSLMAIAAQACRNLGHRLFTLDAHRLPMDAVGRDILQRLWHRESILSGAVLLLHCSDQLPLDSARIALSFVEHLQVPTFVLAYEPLQLFSQAVLTFDVPRLSSQEQKQAWQTTLGPLTQHLNGHLDPILMQFQLSPQSIQTAGAAALERQRYQPGESLETALWETCRVVSRPQMENLAQRIEPMATWDDLVLPSNQRQLLRDLSAHVRQRARVYEEWGFGSRGSRGLGITAMFAGISGTGKTLAAEVLAHELSLDLFRIDLSQVTSKYIGETEKNLRRVFDAAEGGGAILLFDEADALFGKRSEVKDSRDRYANMEVSYLLQRMEAYRGLAILTTNLRDALDSAFMRRLRFVVQFPVPDATHRAEIWRRMFPPQTPTQGLDFKKLARLELPGGSIRSIALNAAFRAADEGTPIGMKHLLQSTRHEYQKLERRLNEAEVSGWV